MLAIAGASGKLGFATLNALLDNKLLAPDQIVCTTSSDSGAKKLAPQKESGVHVRSANWDDPRSYEEALKGCDRLFLISSSRIQKEFGNAPSDPGRERDHITVAEAAQRAGVKHIYYTSLAFAKPSKSHVMEAHTRTEDWLKQSGISHTIIREGLYNESWPLYLGHYSLPDDGRTEISVAGDGRISWTSIPDLGLANALILASPYQEWAGRTIYLSRQKTHTLEEVCKMVSEALGKDIKLKIVSKEQHENYYIEERGMDAGLIRWWSPTYDAVNDNECEIHDNTFEKLFAARGAKPQELRDTIRAMAES